MTTMASPYHESDRNESLVHDTTYSVPKQQTILLMSFTVVRLNKIGFP